MSDETMKTLQEVTGILRRVGMLPSAAEIESYVTAVDASDSAMRPAGAGWRRALVVVDWREVRGGYVMLREDADGPIGEILRARAGNQREGEG